MKYFLLLPLLLCAQVYAATPSQLQASYEVSSSGMKIGQIDESYTREGDRYTLISTTTPLGLLAVFKPGKDIRKSAGQIGEKGLRPERFEHTREGDANKDSSAEFDWNTGQLTLINQPQRRQVALPEGTQDRLSAMYQFMFLKLDNENVLNFFMTDGNKLDDYHYAIGSRQKLTTPAGKCEGLYLDNQAKPGESRTEIWLSAQYNLPCKMIITDSHGIQYIQLLSGLHITP